MKIFHSNYLRLWANLFVSLHKSTTAKDKASRRKAQDCYRPKTTARLNRDAQVVVMFFRLEYHPELKMSSFVFKDLTATLKPSREVNPARLA
jgi:hypothetical protein